MIRSAGAPLETAVQSYIAGENPEQHTLGVTMRHAVNQYYSGVAFFSAGAALSAVALMAEAMLLSIGASNKSSSLAWLQLWDRLTVPPGATADPLLAIPIPAGSATVPGVARLGATEFGPSGLYFEGGITWSLSTAPGSVVTDGMSAGDYTVFGVRV